MMRGSSGRGQTLVQCEFSHAHTIIITLGALLYNLPSRRVSEECHSNDPLSPERLMQNTYAGMVVPKYVSQGGDAGM